MLLELVIVVIYPRTAEKKCVNPIYDFLFYSQCLSIYLNYSITAASVKPILLSLATLKEFTIRINFNSII